MGEIKVSSRLAAVANMVSQGARLADIGTDHGFVPILLIQRKKIEHAIAMDIGKGPLSRAKEHVEELGLEADIELRLSDGMKALLPNEADSIVIAGMGGNLVLKILTDSDPVELGIEEMTLSPQSDVEKVREYLFLRGFIVDNENMVFEDGKFYPIIHVRVCGGESNASTVKESDGDMEEMIARYGEEKYLDFLYGEVLLKDKNPTLLKYLENEQRILEGLKNSLKKSLEKAENGGSEKLEKRLGQVLTQCRLNETALQRVRG
ncbi:MAG: class I SAM-dependent methyltransferase [Lachnospiraceae bacterium]|nr:class I SAM-dependent methyltransferase [Lachnospiraceae bacterium]